ncbi:MAG: 3-oxo-5a-steroid 4- dehydrogenase [Thelocarpon impressellum]|nr:MAG: 3-oxo-5a-steroid 4- dehydrogenase [Thelocarpon impressellum]
MASKAITLAVRPRGKPVRGLPEETNVSSSDSTSELYHRLAAQAGTSVHRLRITKGSDGSTIPNTKGLTVDRTGLREQSVIYVKDLGPQIAWRTVFLVEYLGPLLIHPLVYFLRPVIYGTSESPSPLQTLSLALIVIHFVKRELETLFVHRFSNATMPARNIFKNSFHYWIFGGLNIAYWIYAPSAPTAQPSSPLLTYLALTLFTVGELGNLSAHLTLRNLRSPGGTERNIPRGPFFSLVTCPNYLFETLAWVGIVLATRSMGTVVFVVVAVAQMAAWARTKEAKLRREFGGAYPRKRYAMLPGII